MPSRFDPNARDSESVLEYFRSRALQFLHDDSDWVWSGVVTPLVHEGKEWGCETRLTNATHANFVSVYVYAGARGQGHLRRHANTRPPDVHYVTSPGCGIEQVLRHLDPQTRVASPMSAWPEYLAIEAHYGSERAKRSGVPFMNHIDEGLRVLHRWKHASERSMRAFCLHPLVQEGADLRRTYEQGTLARLDPSVVALALEYRNIANAFLSPMEAHPGHQDHHRIALSPLPEVNTMLVADKIQNFKDFKRHHSTTHPRAASLHRYFTQWFSALEIDPREVDRLMRETQVPPGNVGPPRMC